MINTIKKLSLAVIISAVLTIQLTGCSQTSDTTSLSSEETSQSTTESTKNTEENQNDSIATVLTYPIVDTGTVDFYSNVAIIDAPNEGEPFYGQDAQYLINSPSYTNNNDGTITDNVTCLIWQREMGEKMTFEEAKIAARECTLGGYDDWRLPSAKELQSIVDYSRSFQTTNSAAIDPLFEVSTITDMDGKLNFPYYWSSTTHLDGANPYSSAVYIAFGEAQGIMNNKLMDVHGAGAQRSDPKSGNIEDYPVSQGPQGDIRYVYNYVRCVRTIDTKG